MRVVIITGSDVYEHQRVDLLWEYFNSIGVETEVYSTDFDHRNKEIRNNLKSEYHYIKSRPYKKNISVQRIISHITFSNDVYKAIKNKQVDLLWVLVPPNSLVKSFVRYKRNNPNIKIVFDVIDMWPESMPIRKYKKLPLISTWANIRNKWIDNSDFIITECDLYQSILKQYVKKEKMRTVYLARDILPYRSNPTLPNDKIALCYLGSINNIIDIETITCIISELKRVKPVELHIIGDGENKETLINKAKCAGAIVIYHGCVYDTDEKQRIYDSCHYGLNIMKPEVFVGLTMKSMDYFEAGLPIINNIVGDTWDFVDKYNIGINYTEETLASSLLDQSARSRTRAFFESMLSKDKFFHDIGEVIEQVFQES